MFCLGVIPMQALTRWHGSIEFVCSTFSTFGQYITADSVDNKKAILQEYQSRTIRSRERIVNAA